MVKDYPGLWGHAGPWAAPTAADTARAGIVDHRDRLGVPTDTSPRLPDVLPRSRPAGAVPATRAATSDGTR